MSTNSRADNRNLVDEPGLANILRVTLFAILFSALAFSVFTLFLRWRHAPQLSLVVAASSLLALWLSRSGRRAVTLLPLLTITYVVQHLAARSGGIENIGHTIIPLLVVVSSLLLDSVTLVFFTAFEIFPFSMRNVPSRVRPVKRIVRGSTGRRYQRRVTRTPRAVDLIMSSIDVVPPSSLMEFGPPVACLPCFCAQNRE